MNKNKLFKILVIVIVFILIITFFIYRGRILKPDLKEKIDVPEITRENVIDFTEASEHINQSYWVKGRLDHVFVSGNNNYFLNFCPDFRDCPFSAIIFRDNAHLFENINEWSGRTAHIYGLISTYEGRPQVIIESPSQIKVDFSEGVIKREGVLTEVITVIDGDTIKVRINDSIEYVRLIGIDTPEIDSPYTKEECFGPEASQRLNEILIEREVILLKDPYISERDKYERLLKYAFTPEGELINALLIEGGYAFYLLVEPFSFMNYFVNLEEKAKEGEVGLWGKCRNR